MREDLDQQLRAVGKDYDFHDNALIFAAADRIEQLQEELAQAHNEIPRLRSELANSILKRNKVEEELARYKKEATAIVESNSQNWKGMSGAVAWHLIERHADNWGDVSKMMDEWLLANGGEK